MRQQCMVSTLAAMPICTTTSEKLLKVKFIFLQLSDAAKFEASMNASCDEPIEKVVKQKGDLKMYMTEKHVVGIKKNMVLHFR